MDDIDRAIIDQLRRDARQANTELAEHVGLSPSPCFRRVRRLEADGIILGYHARVLPAAIDRSFEVFADIDLVDHTNATVKRFEKHLAALPNVIDARRMFGSPDYHARIAVADLAAYERFVIDQLMTLPGLSKMQSRFPMKTVKLDPA